MQETSSVYNQILAGGEYRVETRLAAGSKEKPISSLDIFFSEKELIKIKTKQGLFLNDALEVGSCVSGEIDVEMLYPTIEIPRQAKLVPQVRITNGTRVSEWLNKGVFFVDTRQKKNSSTGIQRLVIHGYDAMMKAEQDYPASKLQWPAKDIDVVREIADHIGVEIDRRTLEILTLGYAVQLPYEYTCREVLGYVAAMYGGCFVMNESGQLRLIIVSAIPVNTNYLVDENDNAITFGGVRILV